MKNWEPFVFGPEFAIDSVPKSNTRYWHGKRYSIFQQKLRTTCSTVTPCDAEQKKFYCKFYLVLCVLTESSHPQISFRKSTFLLCRCDWWNLLLDTSLQIKANQNWHFYSGFKQSIVLWCWGVDELRIWRHIVSIRRVSDICLNRIRIAEWFDGRNCLGSQSPFRACTNTGNSLKNNHNNNV